jgi:predicted dehydrogenase
LKKLERFVAGKPTRVSFASRSADKARDFQRKFNGVLAFGSYEEAFAQADIDAVVLCTPHITHRDLAVGALEQGKDVIIEKPIACSVAHADEILARATKLGRHVLVAENHRYRPNVMRLETMVNSGALGVIKLIRINIMRMHQFKQEEWRAIENQMGGGPLIDAGIHWVNVLLTLGQAEPVSITAYEPPITNKPSPREDSIVVTCQFPNGAVGSLIFSWGIHAFPLNFFSVHGSTGSAYSFEGGRFGLVTARFLRPMVFPFRDWRGFVAMWKDFLNGFASGNPDGCLTNGHIGRRDLAFVETAYRRANSFSSRSHEAS